MSKNKIGLTKQIKSWLLFLSSQRGNQKEADWHLLFSLLEKKKKEKNADAERLKDRKVESSGGGTSCGSSYDQISLPQYRR